MQPPPPPPPPPPSAEQPWVEASVSRDFPGWLAEQRVGLAFSTYQAGKLFLIGQSPKGTISVFERTFNRCMGLCATEQSLWMSSLYSLWRFENALAAGENYQGYDRLYVPRVGYTTGDLDIHDIVVEDSGRVVFVNTKFNCLATVSERFSFTPLWRPSFVSKLAAEDRCHLNGLAAVPGERGVSAPRYYVTAVADSDVVDAWRDRRADGGVVVDVREDRIVARGLSMPHSPRWYRGQLWLHNSGTGFFGRIDLERGEGEFVPLTFCPGYLRGLAFVGNYAVVGLSRPRHDKTFGGLQLDENLKQRKAEARCGLHVIDLTNGDTVHWLRLEGMVSELYDVVVLPGAVRPMALGFKSDEIQRLLRVDRAAEL